MSYTDANKELFFKVLSSTISKKITKQFLLVLLSKLDGCVEQIIKIRYININMKSYDKKSF